LKVIPLLLGLQIYTKYPCFLCLWDSRKDVFHYKQKEWPRPTNISLGFHYSKDFPLVDKEGVMLSSLDEKLWKP